MENDPRLRRPSTPKGYPTGWSIKKSEAKTILAEGGWTPDAEFSEEYGYDVYVSEKGELLFHFPTGKSVLYASRAALVKHNEESAKQPQPQHVLEGLLPQGPRFIEEVPALIEELATILKIPRDALDYSHESLDVVEEAIRKRIKPRRRILEIPNLFAGIVAYTGEVARRITGGRWDLNPVHGGIWEPYIRFDDDYVNPFLEPYKSILERTPGSLGLRAIVPIDTVKRLKFI